MLNWGLIGCGDIARKRVAPALRDLGNCRFKGVSRARADLVEAFAREFGAEAWHRDWKELLSDQEIQAVYIATPTYLHAEQTIAAAEAGKHVICEKPMALNVKQCDRMIAACRSNGVFLSIAYYRHFYPLIMRIKEIIATGEIGEVVLAQISAFENYSFAEDDPHHWVFERAKSGGGPLMDFGCHRLEVLLNLLGPVKKVIGQKANIIFDREVEDTTAVQLEFEQGAWAQLTVSTAIHEARDRLDIYGSKGSIHVPVLNGSVVTVWAASRERREDHPPHANIHLPYIQAVTDALLNDRRPPLDGELGRLVAWIGEQVYG